jgi:hypothetical protein
MPGTSAPVTISVPFGGEGSGIGELTWGQREILRAARLSRRSIVLGGVTPLPESWTVDDVVLRVQFLMRRHQSLRTRLVRDIRGGVKQALSASGELTVELYDAAADEDVNTLTDAVNARCAQTDFDEEREWPVRVAVVSQCGVLKYAVFIYNHLMIDGMGLAALLSDLATMDPVTGDAPPPTAMQPLELAERQGTAAARRQCEAALRHWEAIARVAPTGESAVADPQDPPYRELCYRSPAGLLATQSIAARHGTDTGPVLLAACAVALGRVTGMSPVVLLSVVNNRFRPGLADAVMQLAQRSPCLIEVAGRSFEQVLAQARQASLRAGVSGYLDPDECDRMLERVGRERGERVDLSCFYNDRRGPGSAETNRVADPVEISRLLPETSLSWRGQLDTQDNKFFLHINDSPDALDFLICADSRFLGPAGLERCAREFEAVLVHAATVTADDIVVRRTTTSRS